MEMAERRLETPELEELVGAAFDPPLNCACDFLILDGSEIDEVDSTLHFGLRLALVGWPVGHRVGDHAGAINFERFQNNDRDIGGERRDHHVWKQMIDV